MPRFSKNDYLIEVAFRVAVRRKDAAALIAQSERFEEDENEEDAVITAVMNVVGRSLPIEVHHVSTSAQRFASLSDFNDLVSSREGRAPKGAPKRNAENRGPLEKKKNKGRKISLTAADGIFKGLQERLGRLGSYEEFGASIGVVALFGSYLRGEPEVGDIDLAVLAFPLPNYHERRKQLSELRQTPLDFISEYDSPRQEVLRYVKNRSSWVALHELSDLKNFESPVFRIVYTSEEFANLAVDLEAERLSSEEFFKLCEEKRSKLHERIAADPA